MFGVSADEAVGIDKAELFKRVGEQLKNVVPTGQQKRAIQQLFGAEAGLKNIRMFTEGLEEMMQTASDSGTVMADEQIRMAADFKDQLAAFKAETLPIFLNLATSAMGAAVSVVDHVKVIIDALAAAVVKTQEIASKYFDKIKEDAKGTMHEIMKIGAKMTNVPIMLASKAMGGKGPIDDLTGSELAKDLKSIGKAFQDAMTTSMVELQEKVEAREKVSKAAREKSGAVGLSGLGAGRPTKVKADALARIGGFRGGISPEINLLKQQIQQQKEIARSSKKTAENTQVLSP